MTEAKAASAIGDEHIIDISDFGLLPDGSTYFVMEYLDGCTLAEVLAEESQLPIDWVVDIIEQTSSAIDEAHQQGIIHRDLKPDNIWLEPNRRGGYTVKVLDFGLAKLGDVELADEPAGAPSTTASTSDIKKLFRQSTTVAGTPRKTEVLEANTYPPAADVSESATQIQRAPAGEDATLILTEQAHANTPPATESAAKVLPLESSEAATQIQPPPAAEEERTRVFEHTTADNLARQTVPADGLTRVGSILGTPVYMSPEQCRSQPLDPRSDIYSLGVIAYQMVAGEPPFTGPPYELMRLHIEASPLPLKEKRRKIPKKMAALVMSALAKNPADRPATAAGFASALRATSEGTGVLLRRAFALYIEHFPKFFRVTFLMYLPLIALQIALLISAGFKSDRIRTQVAGGIAISTPSATGAIEAILSIIIFFANFVINALIAGVTIRLVTQLFLSPLRPLNLRTAYRAVRKRLKALLVTIAIASIRWVLGLLLIVPGIIMFINYSLAAPVVMMEGLKGRAALKRRHSGDLRRVRTRRRDPR